MTNFEIWQNLRQQTKLARQEKDAKREAITTCEWNDEEKSCIKVFQVQSLGVPNENQSGFEYSIRCCDNFCEGSTCTQDCQMKAKNREYVIANLTFKGLRRARNKAFWDMVFSKNR